MSETTTTVAKKTKTQKIAENSDIVSVNIESPEEQPKTVINSNAKKKGPTYSNIINNPDGIFNSRAADNAFKKKIVKQEINRDSDEEKVAIWSNRNIRWTGVGTLEKGYNIVTQEAYDKWMTKGGIRNATPDEIATYYAIQNGNH